MNRNIPQDEWNIRFPVGNQPVVLADYSNGIRTLVRKMPEIYAKVKKSADAPENDIPQGMFPYDRLLDQREIKKYDCINLIDGSGEENCNISGLGICIDEFLKRDCSVHVREYLPFLREGVIQHHFFYENTEENHHPVYLHFKVLEADPEEDRLKVELAVYEKRVHDVGFLFRQATTFIMDKGNIRAEHSFSGDDLVYIALGMPKTVLTFTDVPIARRMLRDYRFDAEEELKSAQEINGHMLNVFVGTFLHLNRLIHQIRICLGMMNDGFKQRNDIIVCIRPFITYNTFSCAAIEDREIKLIISCVQFQEQIINFIDNLSCTLILFIHLVDQKDRLQAAFQRLLQNESCLRHRTFSRVNQKNNGINCLDDTLNFRREVSVAWCIDNVDLVIFILYGTIL